MGKSYLRGGTKIIREHEVLTEVQDMFEALVSDGTISLEDEVYNASSGRTIMYLTNFESGDTGEFNSDNVIVNYKIVEGYEGELEIHFEWEI